MNILNNLHQLFEPELVQEMLACSEVKLFKEFDVIMDYGKFIRMMPIILSGTVKVMRRDDNGKEILLYYLTSNESCSMAYSCCVELRKSEVRAVAEDDVELLAIPHEKLDEWLCKYPKWKSYIMRSFNKRFLELLKSVESIAFQKLDERLVAWLREKQRLTGSDLIKASHNMIAEDLATNRVVISRLLKQLENDGRLMLYRNEIKIVGHLG